MYTQIPSWPKLLASVLTITSLATFTEAVKPAHGNGRTLVVGDSSLQPEEYSKFFDTLKGEFTIERKENTSIKFI